MKIPSKQTEDFKREFSLGLDHQRKKNFNEAAVCYKKAIQDAEDSFKFYKDVDPSYSWAYNNLGIVFTNLKKKQEGISESFWLTTYEDDYQGEYDYVSLSIPQDNLDKIREKIDNLNFNPDSKINFFPILKHDWNSSLFGKDAIEGIMYSFLFDSMPQI